jgi:Fur family transcriptional regulator, ferric uptake regulator
MPNPGLTRRTPAQNAVLETLRHHQPMSAQSLYSAMRSHHGIGLATVYRSLNTLQKLGFIQHRVTLEGVTLYSLIDRDRHYLTCLHCGQSFAVDDCPMAQFQAELQQNRSFKIYYHTLEFFGLCEPCALQDE